MGGIEIGDGTGPCVRVGNCEVVGAEGGGGAGDGARVWVGGIEVGDGTGPCVRVGNCEVVGAEGGGGAGAGDSNCVNSLVAIFLKSDVIITNFP